MTVLQVADVPLNAVSLGRRHQVSTTCTGRSALVRLGLFFALVGVSVVIASGAIDLGLRRTMTSDFGVFNRMVDGRINAAVVVTGSSRAMNQYDPREISRQTGLTAWNIGVNGSQTDMQLAVLRTYLQHNVAPAILLHNLDSFSFVTSRDGVAFPDLYIPYLKEPAIYGALRKLDSDWWKARYLPLYGYAVQDMRFTWTKGLASLAGRMPRETRFNGFEPRHMPWTEDFDRFKRDHPAGVSFAIEQDAVDDLGAIVKEGTTRGARVVLVYSPVYIEMQRLDRRKAEIFERFRQIAARYGATLWDYSDSPISHHRELFYNSQHLNAAGAAAFSADLARRLTMSGFTRSRLSTANPDVPSIGNAALE